MHVTKAACLALSLTFSYAVNPVAHAATGPVVINEVESNGDAVGDWVELANTDKNNSIDISGWSILDNDDTHTPITFPAGTTIESGGYLAVYTDTDGGFGLGSNDAVRLFDATGALADSTSWQAHASTTWGRVPDTTGEFTGTAEPSRGTRNPGGDTPATTAEAWPFDPMDITDLHVDGLASEDFSGLDFDDAGNLWVVNNGDGSLLKLAESGQRWGVEKKWTLHYADGPGKPDAEGVAVGPDGRIYVATERNNAAKSTSRPSILTFTPDEATDELAASQEFNLSDLVGSVGANAGLEAVDYVPGAWGGVFAVGVEGTGDVLFVSLGETAELKQRYDSPFAGVMALDYRPQDAQLRILCDEACDGQSQLVSFNGTEFTAASEIQARPAAMNNVANEGFASRTTESACVNGSKTTRETFVWADDAYTGGVALRQGARETSTSCSAALSSLSSF